MVDSTLLYKTINDKIKIHSTLLLYCPVIAIPSSNNKVHMLKLKYFINVSYMQSDIDEVPLNLRLIDDLHGAAAFLQNVEKKNKLPDRTRKS